MSLIQLAEHRCFGGRQLRFEHHSNSLNCVMQLAVFLPPQAQTQRVPVLYWLSGLTCTDENFSVKAGAQRIAAELGIALVMPDTSPRGEQVANDPAYDLGQGAGFYINATQAPWATHYQMYDYMVDELPLLLEQELPLSAQRAISGHSMGGHGALVIALRNPQRYSSVSAFSPICQPSACAWGEKAFSTYLGDDRSSWAAYDASSLLQQMPCPLPLLVDQGLADQFYPAQLRTEALQQALAAQPQQQPVEVRLHDGYDHSYYFISSFIEQHLRFHATWLQR